jgi:hypothetical protein
LKEAYEKDCVPIIELAKWSGVSRQALWKFFKKNGVETRKTKATRRVIKCDHCLEDFEITRARYRNQVLKGGAKKHFCSDNCYYLYLGNSDSAVNRHKQRIARSKVSEVFDLKDGHVVHHIDGDHFNTMLENFMAFENNSDHIKHHYEVRRGEVVTLPIWDGSGGPLKEAVKKTEKKIKGSNEKEVLGLPTGIKNNEFFNPRPKESQTKKGAK